MRLLHREVKEMIGLEFSLNKSNRKILEDIINYASLNYEWYISESDIVHNNDSFFLDEKYTGAQMKELFENYFDLIIFLNAQGYKSGAKKSKILEYLDFKKSNCELLLLIYDADYVEIYSKDESLLKRLSLKYSNDVKVKTEKNDNRTKMELW